MSEHYLTADTWSVDGQPELGEVRLASIHHIDRTIAAIHVIARMIGNSAYEPDAGNNAPLDPWAVQGLMAGVESLCHYVKLTTEGMLQQAARAAKPGGCVMAIRLPTNKQAAADTALSDIRETSQRCRALLDVITGDGFSYFSTLDGELQEAYLHQAFMLTAEVNDLAAAALQAQAGGTA